MRRIMVTLALTLSPATGFAQSAPDTVTFRALAATIAADPAMAGQWIILLPAIARRCRLAVDQERVTGFVDQLDHPEAVDEATDFYAAHPDSRLKASWEGMAGRDQGEACRLAASLWGLHGALAPGVLRVPTDSTRRKVSQHPADGFH